MSAEQELAEALHAASSHRNEGPAKTCGECRHNVLAILPVVRAWMEAGARP